jgi:hypothetical protein
MTPRVFALFLLILAAALTRLLPHPANFAPITAMAVFGAIRFADRRTAVLAPLVALLLSDLLREVLYRQGLVADWGLYRGMWVVYGTTALVALLGRLAHGTRSVGSIAATTLVGSCLFFGVTNFAVWAGGSLYPRTVEGLMSCYTAAIPFFKNSLLGDACYATILFGGWALVEVCVPALRPATATGSE